METRLPWLISNFAKAVLPPVTSNWKSAPRSHLQTDLNELVSWDTFPTDIDTAIKSTMKQRGLTSDAFSIGGMPEDATIENEVSIHAHVKYALNIPLEKVTKRLGLQGELRFPGSGNTAIVGAPDFSWVVDVLNKPHPTLVVEYKPWWGVDLARILAAFNGTDSDPIAKQTLEALQQVYGYMTFNNTKFGILSCWTHALFLRRVETPERKCLEYHLVKLDGPTSSMSMLKAWVGILLLADKECFYASPTICLPPVNRHFRDSAAGEMAHQKAVIETENFNMLPSDGTYKISNLNFRVCKFELSSMRDGGIDGGCIVWGGLFRSVTNILEVVFKVVDAYQYPDASDVLQDEANAYAALYDLQGKVIPRVYGLYEVWGILQVLALQPVGDALSDKDAIDVPLRKKMKSTLQEIHNAGFLHGNISRSSFCRKGKRIFLVDLKFCRRATVAERAQEMSEVGALV